VAFNVPLLDNKALPLPMPKDCQAFLEVIDGLATGSEQSDPMHLFRQLRSGGERPGEQRDGASHERASRDHVVSPRGAPALARRGTASLAAPQPAD